MSLVTEYLSGGLDTATDPALLKPGELQVADECVYRAFDPALYRAPGRTVYNTTVVKDSSGTTGPVKGMAWLPFGSTRTDQLLVLGGNDNGKGTLWAGDFTVIDGSATLAQLTGPGQVTDAAINNSTTMSSASGGFAFMVAGARVTGTGIPANTFVSSVTNSTTIVLTNATTGGSQTVTATFDMGIAVAPSDTGDEILDTIQWAQTYYAIFGHGDMQRVFYKSRSITGSSLADLLIARPAGLAPVALQPKVDVNSGAGHTWSAVLGNGYYWFLVTEVINPDQPDEIEGTYSPKDDKGTRLGPVVGHITDFTLNDVTITRPTQVNDGSSLVGGRLSTHWRIYMSPTMQDSVTTPSLALFRLVATVPMTATSFTLADAVVTRSGYPTAKAAVAGRNEFAFPTQMLNAPDNLAAAGKSGSSTDGAGTTVPMNKLQTFGFSGSDGTFTGLTVVGIQVAIRGLADPSGNAGRTAGYALYLQTTGGKNSGPIFGAFGSKNFAINLHGSNYDTLGVSWAASDFAVGGGFEVWVEKVGTGARQRLWVDSVKVTVFYSGTSVNLNGKSFRVITYRDQVGNILDIPARGMPPEASTGDLFQGSMVVNDLANEDAILWSLPGEPEAFPGYVDKGKPGPYVLKFEERRHNKVNFIRRCGQILVVGLSDAVKRVNYLPSETDTDLHEGLAHEDISSDHGIVGPLAGCLFTMPQAGTMLAYVAQNGLHATDGVTARFLSVDLKWINLVDPANLSKCVLRNYPREQWLVLYYPPLGGSGKLTRALIFPYSQDKIKHMTIPNTYSLGPPTLPAIGPVSVSGHSAVVGKIGDQYYLLTGHYTSGLIYTEDNGFTIPAGYTTDGTEVVTGAPRIKLRKFAPGGIDRNARVERIYIHFSPTGSAVVTTNCTFTKGSATVTMASTTGIVKGMLVATTNIAADTIVLSVDSGTQITVSAGAFEGGVFSTIFDNSTIAVTINRQNIGEAVTTCQTVYTSMLVGALAVVHPDNQGQFIELRFDKVLMPDGSRVDAGVDMKINFIAFDIADAGKEQNRTGV